MSKSKTRIQSFDTTTCRAIQEECAAALQAIADKYGLLLKRKGGTYHRTRMPVMMEFLVEERDGDGTILTPEAKLFKSYAMSYGLVAEDLGKEFTAHGKVYRITGCKPKSQKYPILVQEVMTGRTFKLPATTVKMALKSAA
jgi:hypothetical protein